MTSKSTLRTILVKMQCVSCKAKEDIDADSVAPGSYPLCKRCSSPMATLSVSVKSSRGRS